VRRRIGMLFAVTLIAIGVIVFVANKLTDDGEPEWRVPSPSATPNTLKTALQPAPAD
jgi:hypothetical protein